MTTRKTCLAVEQAAILVDEAIYTLENEHNPGLENGAIKPLKKTLDWLTATAKTLHDMSEIEREGNKQRGR